MTSDFAHDVDKGLSANNKYLLSRYFYDKTGDALFVKIMSAPEYYLTNAEFEIMAEQGRDIINSLEFNNEFFEIYELGAGDGTKTIELIRDIPRDRFAYYPIDISQNALDKLEQRIHTELPGVSVEGIQGEYFKVLSSIPSEHNKLVLFLGSNLGNFLEDKARAFIALLAGYLDPGDKVLVGLDLKKPAEIILPAYNDAQGYTKAFNLNLLVRINRELGGDFDVAKFAHRPQYLEDEGLALSYLVSTEEQEVFIEKLNKTFHFEEGERIHTEVSRKFDIPTVDRMIKGLGLRRVREFYDNNKLFMDVLIEKT